MENNEVAELNKKERKEYLKNLRAGQSGKDRKTRLLVGGLIVTGVVLAGAGLFYLSNLNATDKIPPVGELVDEMPAPNTALHIEVGAQHVPYSTNPPTSGPHYNASGAGPIECKVYEDEVVDEGVIHNLEHGAVWVTYQDKNDTDLAGKLKVIVEDYSKTVLSPRSKNDSKIALVAWRHILKLDQFDEKKIRDFIRLYKSSKEAPEPLAGR